LDRSRPPSQLPARGVERTQADDSGGDAPESEERKGRGRGLRDLDSGERPERRRGASGVHPDGERLREGHCLAAGAVRQSGRALHTFDPPHFGHAGKGFVMAGQGLTKGLVGAGGCWWESSTASAICLVDIEAVAKPVVAHANQLAAVAVAKFL